MTIDRTFRLGLLALSLTAGAASAQTAATDAGTDQARKQAIDLEVTAMMDAMHSTCSKAFPDRAAQFQAAWDKTLKASSAQMQEQTRNPEYAARREHHLQEQSTRAAQPGKQQELQEACEWLLKQAAK